MTILTPKGYSPARQPDSERPAEEAQADATGAASAAEPARVQLRFPPQVIGVSCPSCGTPYPAQLFSIVDVGQDPVLKSLMLQGQLNTAVCPRCGSGGAISTPMIYHDPEHSFLGVYVPEQTPVNEQQQVIGQLSKRLMDGLPAEARRGYMLTPKQFLSYQSLLEAILENEGVTREMLDKQRRQIRLVEQALTTLKDPEGLKLLVSERDAEMDDEFFGILNLLTDSSGASGDPESLKQLLTLRERLIELTTWGKGVQKQRAAIAQLTPQTTSSQLLDMIVAAEDDRVVDALATAGRPLINYSFYQELTRRAEEAEARGDGDTAKRLTDLREHILEVTEQLDQLQRTVLQQASQVLGDILASDDIEEAVAQYAAYIDQNFLSVLAANLQQAERQGATAAVKRLQVVWDAALGLIQQEAPPEVRLVNNLINAEYPGETRKILKENRELVTVELVDMMSELVNELETEGNADVAARLRQIRAQAQLMV